MKQWWLNSQFRTTAPKQREVGTGLRSGWAVGEQSFLAEEVPDRGRAEVGAEVLEEWSG